MNEEARDTNSTDGSDLSSVNPQSDSAESSDARTESAPQTAAAGDAPAGDSQPESAASPAAPEQPVQKAAEQTPASSTDAAPDPAVASEPKATEASTTEASATEPDASPDAATASASSDDGDAAKGATEAKAKDAKDGKASEAAGAAAKKAAPRAGAASLYRAFRSNRALEGLVERVIKGGYEIKVGRARGFCPHSQMDVQRIEDTEVHIGKTYRFRITQVRRGGADVVLSRRALLEDARKEEAKAVRATLIEGSIMQGRIAGTAPFGAFVDLGAGVMGLVHVSELSHSRLTDVAAAVKVGDSVKVKILKLDDKRGRVSLSRRQAEADPWIEAAEQFKPGETYPGTVQRLADFGVFVEVAPGIEALAPASELPPSRTGWRDQLTVGTSRDWIVLSADPSKRRISLTLPVEGFEANTVDAVKAGAKLEGKVQRVERFGVFVWLGPGMVGLMPNIATGTRPGTDLARQFPVGETLKVDVAEVSEDGRKIRLAIEGYKPKAADKDRVRTDDVSQRAKGRRTHEAQTLVQDPGTSFGTSLADKLKAALDTGKP